MTRSQHTTRPRKTRLRSILLAGTILPMLAVGAATSIHAQAPDQPPGEHHPPRAHEGEPHGGGAREPGSRAEHRQNGADHQQAQQPEGGHGGARAQRNGEGEAPQHGRKARAAGTEPGAPTAQSANPAPGAHADDSARPGRKHRDEANPTAATSPAVAPDHAAPARQADEDRANRRERRGAERGNDNGASSPGADQGRNRHERAGDSGPRPDDRDKAQRDDRNDAGRNNADTSRPDGARPADRALGDERRPGDRPRPDDARRDTGAPTRAGLAGGFLPPAAGARRLDDIRSARRETREGDRVFIREPGHTIVQEQGRAFIVHDETDRFRALGLDVRRERRGANFVDTVRRPNGDLILTFTDPQGRMLRRVRRGPDGREVVLIDNGYDGGVRPLAEDVVTLPPPPVRIPRDRYIVDYRDADAGLVYDTLVAPPLAPPPRRYTLDQIRYSPDIRSYIRQVDINTINFDTGSWTIPDAASGKLDALATALKRAIGRNPNAVFLVEGFTDAVGNPDDNLSLSDRRAQSVAEVLTRDFGVPPENLTTQGYGEQNLKENTQGPSAANRRVVVQNITPLLAAGGGQPEGQ